MVPYEIGCQLHVLLITNRKSHMGFRLAPTSVTLDDLEWHSSPYIVFIFTEFDSFAGRLCHSDWRCPQNIVFQFYSSTFGQTNAPCSAVSLW